MRFQYISDIHLEFRKSIPEIPVCADILILAGDIGHAGAQSYRDFVTQVARKFQHVIVIAGNHEYYNRRKVQRQSYKHITANPLQEMADDDAKIRALASEFYNVHFLQNEWVLIAGRPGTPEGNIAVFGATFWTKIPNESRDAVRYYINDYNCIPGFSIETSNALHAASIAALSEALPQAERWIVISHHLPQTSLIAPKYRDCKYNAAFASDIDLAEDPRILYWVYGHTHQAHSEGKFRCNPIGYPGENKDERFDATFDSA